MKERIRTPIVRSTTVIFLCFLLTSTGWLSWEYHLMDQVSARAADVCTMVIGYLLQAAGVGLFAALLRLKQSLAGRVVHIALILHIVCMIPAVLSPYLVGTLVFGFLMNLICGIIAGYYLYDLTRNAVEGRKATAFGIGYGLAILSSWLLSLIDGGAIYYSEKVLIVCIVLTVIAIPVVGKPTEEYAKQTQKRAGDMRFLISVSVLVLLFSLVNSSGFAFPTADLGQAVNLELSRLVYAAGLMIAGFVTDQNRKYGAICALTALMIPFIILSLRGVTVSAVIFWVIAYFTFGFYSIHRVILFSDLAEQKNLMFLSGFGLMIGRIGDALGEGICIAFTDRLMPLVCLTAALFAAAVAVFFRVYHILYMPARQQSEREKFYQFSMQHDLSAREQEMLRLLLEKKTNAEIADILSISENTVKFHIRNLLQKTGCKNRNDLVTVYLGT